MNFLKIDEDSFIEGLAITVMTILVGFIIFIFFQIPDFFYIVFGIVGIGYIVGLIIKYIKRR